MVEYFIILFPYFTFIIFLVKNINWEWGNNTAKIVYQFCLISCEDVNINAISSVPSAEFVINFGSISDSFLLSLVYMNVPCSIIFSKSCPFVVSVLFKIPSKQ